MELSKYFKNQEPSEIILFILFSCIISSILFNSFKANSTISIFFGLLGGYFILELRKSKKIVPTILIDEKSNDLIKILENERELKDNIKWIKKYPKILEVLHDCILIAKNDLSSFSDCILTINIFCKNISLMTENNNKYHKKMEYYQNALILVPEILNSVHSLIYSTDIDNKEFENRLYSLRNEIRKLLKNIRKRTKIIDNNPLGFYNYNVSSYDFF